MSDPTPQPVNAGTSGPHFCEWSMEHWDIYRGGGGACGILQLVPVVLRPDGPIEVTATMPASFCNALGMMHGGASSMLLDEVGGLAVCCSVGFRYLRGTRTLEVEFLKRAGPGPVTVRAEVLERDETSMLVEAVIVQRDAEVASAKARYAIYAPGKAKLPAQPAHA